MALGKIDAVFAGSLTGPSIPGGPLDEQVVECPTMTIHAKLSQQRK
jgi:hypothetical protein